MAQDDLPDYDDDDKAPVADVELDPDEPDEAVDPDLADLDEAEIDLDEELLDEELLDDDLALGGDDLVVDDDEEEGEADDVVVEPAAPRKKRAGEDEEEDDDEDELDPDDVEADLDTILKDRISSGDDTEEDEEEEAEAAATGETSDLPPRRADEWACDGCFLIVSVSQFGRRSNPQCPSGEDECPSIARILAGG